MLFRSHKSPGHTHGNSSIRAAQGPNTEPPNPKPRPSHQNDGDNLGSTSGGQHKLRPAWLAPLLPLLILCHKVPGHQAQHPDRSLRGAGSAPQQHTLLPASEARQCPARGLSTGPSFELDAAASLGRQRGDEGHQGRLSREPGLQTSTAHSARRETCPFTATSSTDGGCHPRMSPAAREWTQLLAEALTLGGDSAR